MTVPATIITAVAISEAGRKAKETCDEIITFLTPGEPSTEDKILARLDVLHQDFVALQGKFDEVLAAVLQAVSVEQQALILTLQRDLDRLRGQARAAVDQLSTWSHGGRTNAALRVDAANNSLLSANTLLESESFFYRPDLNSNEHAFDHRLAYITYAYALTVRFGIIAALNPQFRNNALTRTELTRHAARMDWIFHNADLAIEPWTNGQVNTKDGTYSAAYACTDHISGYKIEKKDTEWRPGGQAQLEDALALFAESVRARVHVEAGLAHVLDLRDTMAYWGKDPRTAGWSPWTALGGVDTPTPWSATAASERPGHATLVWRDPSKGQLRTLSYDPTANPPAWPRSVAITAENTVASEEGGHTTETRLATLSPGPGLITTLFVSHDMSDLCATHTDATQPTGWLPAPVKVIGNADHGFLAASAPGLVVVCRRDDRNGTLMAAVQDANGTWSTPQAPIAENLFEQGFTSCALVCPSPGVATLFWITKDNAIHSVAYDSHVPAPAWSAPSRIAVATSIARYDAGLFAASASDGEADLFWVSADRAIWNLHYDGTWSTPVAVTPPRSTSGLLGSRIVAVAAEQHQSRVFWLGGDGSIHTMVREAQHTRWSAPLRLGPPWRTMSELNTAWLPDNSVSLYWADADADNSRTIRSCFYETGRSAPAARFAEAQALITQAQTLWNLPGPAREEAVARTVDAITLAREVAAVAPSYRPQLAQWEASPATALLAATGHWDEALAMADESINLYRELI
ncbi:tetratricopeptide repeat protein, partial [Streptomyces melanogenes]|uniref:tetratricopeptide repeat protein n=1 Tax=Streptomyces melanogenes TaxID=67326 RepID=UPI00167D8E55